MFAIDLVESMMRSGGTIAQRHGELKAPCMMQSVFYLWWAPGRLRLMKSYSPNPRGQHEKSSRSLAFRNRGGPFLSDDDTLSESSSTSKGGPNI